MRPKPAWLLITDYWLRITRHLILLPPTRRSA